MRDDEIEDGLEEYENMKYQDEMDEFSAEMEADEAKTAEYVKKHYNSDPEKFLSSLEQDFQNSLEHGMTEEEALYDLKSFISDVEDEKPGFLKAFGLSWIDVYSYFKD
jgi:DNA-nicking Smr family endonuclease